MGYYPWQNKYQPQNQKTSFRVKKPVRSFRDLEVYQKSAELAVTVATRVCPLLGEGPSLVRDRLIECVLRIPETIASAHSRRFEHSDMYGRDGYRAYGSDNGGTSAEPGPAASGLPARAAKPGPATPLLEDALDNCNRAVVFIEQARDIYIKDTDARAACEEVVKAYILVRRKIFNLLKAWKNIDEGKPGWREERGERYGGAKTYAPEHRREDDGRIGDGNGI